MVNPQRIGWCGSNAPTAKRIQYGKYLRTKVLRNTVLATEYYSELHMFLPGSPFILLMMDEIDCHVDEHRRPTVHRHGTARRAKPEASHCGPARRWDDHHGATAAFTGSSDRSEFGHPDSRCVIFVRRRTSCVC